MEEATWIGPFLTGGLAVALVKLIEVIVTRWMDNRVKEKQGKQMDVEGEIAALTKAMKALTKSQRIILHDRIKWLGRSHIERGEIRFEDRDDLTLMHSVYREELGGNGALNHLMTDVLELPVKK